jgi:hypothetical protein
MNGTGVTKVMLEGWWLISLLAAPTGISAYGTTIRLSHHHQRSSTTHVMSLVNKSSKELSSHGLGSTTDADT